MAYSTEINRFSNVFRCPNLTHWDQVKPSLVQASPDSKVHGVNMESTWVLSAPDGPHIGPMNLTIREGMSPGWRRAFTWWHLNQNEKDIYPENIWKYHLRNGHFVLSFSSGTRFAINMMLRIAHSRIYEMISLLMIWGNNFCTHCTRPYVKDIGFITTSR